MSATRDKSLKVGFVYSNLYEMYKRTKETPVTDESPVVFSRAERAGHTAPAAPPSAPHGLTKSKIIKAGTAAALEAKDVREFSPPAFISKQVAEAAKAPLYVAKPEVLKHSASRPENQAFSSLKESLDRLSDLHSRLKFMLKDLEDLTKE